MWLSSKDKPDPWSECCKILDQFVRNRNSTGKRLVLPQTKYTFVYDTIYKLCSDYRNRRGGDNVYKRFEQLITDLLEDLNLELEDARGIFKIKKLEEVWEEYTVYLNFLCRLFGYVDNSYVKQNLKMPLYILGLERFKDITLTTQQLEHMQTIFIQELNSIRESKIYSSVEVLESFVSMLLKLSEQYAPFTETVEALKKKQLECSHEWLSLRYREIVELPCTEYYTQAESLLVSESEIIMKCFGEAPIKQLQQSFVDIFIRRYKTHLVSESNSNSWMNMLLNRNVKYLQRTCQIYQKWSDFQTLKTQYEKFVDNNWRKYMQETIAAAANLPVVRDLQVRRQYVLRRMFENNERHSQLNRECLNNLSIFLSVYKTTTERVLAEFNHGDYQLNQLLLMYWNRLVRMESFNPKQFKYRADEFMKLFELLHDKSSFITNYGQHLVMEMINGKEVKIERERVLISLLIHTCGATDTGYLEWLIESHEQNLKNVAQLESHMARYGNHKLSLNLFRSEGWALQRCLPDTSSPKKLFTIQEAILETHVKEINKNYKIFFDRLLGSVKLEYKHCTPSFDLIMNDLQAAIVLFVQNHTKVSIKQILQEMMSFRSDSLIREQVRLLIENSKPLLKKDDDECYEINTELQSTESIVYSPAINLKKPAIAIEQDLTLRVEAYVMRRMKMYKEMEFAALLNDTMRALTLFRPEAAFVKGCIHKLIDYKMLEKDGDSIKYVPA